MPEGRRTAMAIVISLVLVATAVASLWLMASAGVFTAEGSQLPGAPSVMPDEASNSVTFPIGGRVQVNQPRDPFAPLASVPLVVDPTGGGSTSTTAGDGSSTSTTTGDGASTTTSATTTTSVSTTTQANPVGTRIALLEVRDEAGVRRAVLTVDGETYTVGVGDVFSEDELKVVSLSDASGVFQLDDRVFSLSVGQSILK